MIYAALQDLPHCDAKPHQTRHPIIIKHNFLKKALQPTVAGFWVGLAGKCQGQLRQTHALQPD